MSIWDSVFGQGGDKRVTEARRLLRMGEFDRAGDLFYMAEHFDDAIQCYIKSGAFAKAASLYDKTGRQREAAECFLKAKDFQTAANLLVQLGDAARAILIFENQGEFFKAAHLAEGQKRFSKAAALYLKAGHFDRASQVFALAGDHKGAAEALERLVSKMETANASDRAQGYSIDLYRHLNTLGQYWEQAGNFAEAGAVYERGSQFVKAAQNYERSGQNVAAIRMYSRLGEASSIERLMPKVSVQDLGVDLASEVLITLGRYEEAAKLLESSGDYGRAAGLFERAGNRRSAAVAYEKAGDDGTAGELRLSLGEYEHAADLLIKARSYELAAEALRNCGRHQDAAEYFLSAGDEVKGAEIFYEIGNYDRSIDILQRMKHASADPSTVALLLAENFRAKRLFSLAADKYRESIGDQPPQMGNLRSLYGLALCQEAMGQLDLARIGLEKVLSIDYGYADARSRLDNIMHRITPVSTPSPSGVSTLLRNRYELTEKSPFSDDTDVFQCWDKEMGRTLQMERIPVEAQDAGQTKRMIEAARTASRLVHTNIVMIYDVFEESNGAYICKENLKGKSLRNIIEEGGLPVAKINPLTTQIAEALNYAHGEGILHRTLRPECVFLTDQGIAKVTGFGHERSPEDMRRPGPFGVPPIVYAAPELFRGLPLDKRSDIFSLGACLYELFTLKLPYPATAKGQPPQQPPEPLGKIRPDLPQNLQNAVMKCLEIDPDRRYQTGRQILEDLRTIEIIPGMVISDRYELIKEIGSGGMGRIFKALDRELEEVIALKLLRSEFGLDPVIEQRFVREIKLSRKVVHTGIVSVFDIGKWNGMRYITMEFIEGINLERWIEEQGSADIATLARLSVQIAEALAAAHRSGVVHRDIKPQNILVNRDGKTKIVDFGIARMRSASELTSTGQLIGSPKYMSPEQIRGDTLDPRTDVYSFGVVMYLLFTRREPITGDSPNTILMKQIYEQPVPPCQVNPELPPWVELVIMKAMAKDINVRYQNMGEIIADFKRFLMEDGRK